MLGKYLAAMCLYTALIGLSLFYYLGVVRCLGADIDHGQVLAGYIGMFLFGSGLVSIGLMVSAFCRKTAEQGLLNEKTARPPCFVTDPTVAMNPL